ncbi:MAG TPA: hypothetical protein VFZ35_03335 [Sphingomicrobium sp.]
MRLRRLAILLMSAGLAACGNVAPLEPRPGQPLPVKPLMAATTPTAEQLLTPPPYARPERVDELIKRSAPRRADRFDLPPPDGGAAPAIVGEEETSSDQAGPVTPQ